MKVSPTDLFITKGYNREGIPYKKSNTAKTLLTTACAGVGAKALKVIAQDTFESSKKIKVAKEFTAVALLASFGFALGSIVDGIINKFSSKHASDKALAGVSSEKHSGELNTHQG